MSSRGLVEEINGMKSSSTQTDECGQEDLDWDLSDHVDRETQTNSRTDRNGIDAIVQTDCRYLPLASISSSSVTTNTENQKLAKQFAEIGTQTIQRKANVSTQTEDNIGLKEEDEPQIVPRTPMNEVDENDSLDGIITTPLLPRRTALMEDSSNQTRSNSLYDLRNQKDTFELWKRLAPLTIDEFMPTIQFATKVYQMRRRMVDIGIQTEIREVESDKHEFLPRPPSCKKMKLLEGTDLVELDLQVLGTNVEGIIDPTQLVTCLCKNVSNDLHKIRIIFRWVAENIRFDWKYIEKQQSASDILKSQSGVVKDYILLCQEMCSIAGIRTQKIQGFAKGLQTRVGKTFVPGKDHLHAWLAVFIFGSWRLIDPAWGAGFMDDQGRFHPSFEEHYFLTNPSDLSLTHHPYNPDEEEYERWQLVDKPLTLDQFNQTPKVSPAFFALQMRLRMPKTHSVVFRQQTDIQVSSSLLLRYKFNFFPVDEGEEASENQWVFCQLREGGVVGSFTIIAPRVGKFILKVYAVADDKPETKEDVMPIVISFILISKQARRYPVPWPIHEGVWGPTPRLYESGLDPINQNGPIIVSWGSKMVLSFEKIHDILLMCQVFDCSGNMLDSKSVLRRHETEDEIRLTILPPGIGFYKLLLYGMTRPQIRGRWQLPLLAAYLVECKMCTTSYKDTSADEGDIPERKDSSRRIRAVRR